VIKLLITRIYYKKTNKIKENKMSELRILGKGGDTKISWDAHNEMEVNAARETFDKRIKDGWSAFRDKNGSKGEKIKIFDNRAERIVLVPPISGG
jgi:hypothetical protein